MSRPLTLEVLNQRIDLSALFPTVTEVTPMVIAGDRVLRVRGPSGSLYWVKRHGLEALMGRERAGATWNQFFEGPLGKPYQEAP